MRANTKPRAIDAHFTTFDRLFADIQARGPGIAARSAEIEAERRTPPDLVETLRSIGVFRMFVPRSHGGLELDAPSACRIFTALSRIDASVGWNAIVGSLGSVFATLLPRDLYEEVYRDGSDVIFAGASQPGGKAEVVDGAWRVSGRWPFASGCQHAEWLLGFCVMTKDGQPLPGAAAGMPLVKACLLPARDWVIEDTWFATGLCGTGSHHIVLNDAVVPEDHFLDVFGGAPCVSGPLYYAAPQLIPVMHGAVDIGIAEGAVDDLVGLANTGRQQQRATAPMCESEIFQYELGRIEADLRAATAAYEAQIASHWRHALAGTLKDEALLTEGAQTAVWVSATCVRVVDACFALAGGSAIYDHSPLQRRMRDMHVAAQHASVHPRQYMNAGALLLERSRSTLPSAAR